MLKCQEAGNVYLNSKEKRRNAIYYQLGGPVCDNSGSGKLERTVILYHTPTQHTDYDARKSKALTILLLKLTLDNV